jgi:hypothetical protein
MPEAVYPLADHDEAARFANLQTSLVVGTETGLLAYMRGNGDTGAPAVAGQPPSFSGNLSANLWYPVELDYSTVENLPVNFAASPRALDGVVRNMFKYTGTVARNVYYGSVGAHTTTSPGVNMEFAIAKVPSDITTLAALRTYLDTKDANGVYTNLLRYIQAPVDATGKGGPVPLVGPFYVEPQEDYFLFAKPDAVAVGVAWLSSIVTISEIPLGARLIPVP